MEEYENATIGEDKPQVEPKVVKVMSYEKMNVKNFEGKEVGDKLVLKVKHPDITDREIEISSVKYEADGKIKQSGLWFKLDKDNKLPYKSALANLLRFVGVGSVKDLKDKELKTLTDDRGYLCVKAY